MSKVELLEAERRSLVTKVVYAEVEGRSNPEDRARLDLLEEELLRLTAANFYFLAKSDLEKSVA